MGSQTPINKDRSRTYWTPTMERYFVDLMLEHMNLGNRVGHTFNKQAWNDMLAVFNAKFGSQYDKDVLKSRYTNLWKQFNDVKIMLSQSGFSWDETRNMVVADDYIWDSYIKAHPDARQYRTKSVQNFSDLCLIYEHTTADGRYSRSSHDVDIDDEVNGVNLGDGIQSVIPSNTERSRTDWTTEMDNFLTELLLHQGQKDIMILLKQDDFLWDTKEQKVVANDDVWDAYLKTHPQARTYRTKSMPNYKDLELIFGSDIVNGSQKDLDEDIGSKTGNERSRTYWTPPMDRYLVDLLVDHVNKGNKIGHTFIAQAWIEMVKSFNANFNSNHDKDVLKNRYKHLKRQYNDINTLLGETGFSWDDTREMVVAQDHIWDAYIKVHPDARCYRVKMVSSYNKLSVIYGEDNSEGRYGRLARDVSIIGESDGIILLPNNSTTNSNTPTKIEDTNPIQINPQEIVTPINKKRPTKLPLTLQPACKVQKIQKDDIKEALVNKKTDDNKFNAIEKAVDALQAIPDLDDELLLDGCDVLENEKKAKTFLALDASLRKKWLLRKLGR
ncbi:unnamed protein product [Lactuca virosa]|uniref:Myb/SANT-like domain-containing protein n=1 Tax=Lactuca virosa TaxID=75947 RepID=A0AAU9PSY7_9ASTR|nr:unnamed protein product [Lactuca virosa]